MIVNVYIGENSNNYTIDKDDEFNNIINNIVKKAIMYTPVSTGNLLNSLKVNNKDDYVIIEYDCKYGSYVHENLSIPHTEPTRAKFLEDAINEVLNDTKLFAYDIEYYPYIKAVIYKI